MDRGVIAADEGVKGVFILGESARAVGSWLLPMLQERRRLRDNCLLSVELADGGGACVGITSGGRSFGDTGGRAALASVWSTLGL